MVMTQHAGLADRVRRYGNFCYGARKRCMHDDVGYNYRMPNVSAALGLGQFRRIDQILEKKRAIHERYTRNLSDVPGFHIPVVRPWAKSVMWMFNAYLGPEFGMTRDELARRLHEQGIETRESFIPINMQKVFLDRG